MTAAAPDRPDSAAVVHPASPSAPAAPPAGRYGPPRDARSRRRGVVAVVVLALAGSALAVWLGLEAARTPVTWQDVGFEIQGTDAVEVVYDVSRADPSQPARCRLQALNERFAQVGVRTVDLSPSSDRTERHRTTVAISEAAVTGVVEDCWIP